MTLEQAQQQPCQKMHQVVGSQVAATAYIPLPPNVEELQASEKVWIALILCEVVK